MVRIASGLTEVYTLPRTGLPRRQAWFVVFVVVTAWLQPGILRDFSEHGKLRDFCATSGKNCNKQHSFSSSFKYLCKTAVDWVNRISVISGSSDPAQ